MGKCWCLLVVDGQSVSQHQGFLQIHHLIVNSARICLGAANSQVFQKHPKTIKNLFLGQNHQKNITTVSFPQATAIVAGARLPWKLACT
jgi:hypothetical protein